jgi:hypothetical protein
LIITYLQFVIIRNQRLSSPNQEPEALKSKSETRGSQLKIRNQRLSSPNQKPETLNSKSETRGSQLIRNQRL